MVFPNAFKIWNPCFLTWHRRGSSFLVFLFPAHHLYIPIYICLSTFIGWICPTSESNVGPTMIKSTGSVARLLGFKSQLCYSLAVGPNVVQQLRIAADWQAVRSCLDQYPSVFSGVKRLYLVNTYISQTLSIFLETGKYQSGFKTWTVWHSRLLFTFTPSLWNIFESDPNSPVSLILP